MKAKLLLLSSICLIVSIAKVFAQDVDTTNRFNDYIISLKNDTIKCHLGSRFLGKLTYKVEGARRAKPFDADSVNGFYRAKDSSFFVPRRLPEKDKLIFLRLVEGGRIKLYEREVSGTKTSSFFYFVSKNNDSLKLIKVVTMDLYIGSSRKSREQIFMNLIADNPALLDKYKEERKTTNYNFELIQFYVKLYNDGFLANQKTTK